LKRARNDACQAKAPKKREKTPSKECKIAHNLSSLDPSFAHLLTVVVERNQESNLFLTMSMYVLKRNGKKESVHFDKITSRISKLCYGLDAKVCTIRTTIQPTTDCALLHYTRTVFYNLSSIIISHHLSITIATACGRRRHLAKGHPGSLPRRYHLGTR